MWYEIIPAALVVMSGVGLPQYGTYYIYKWWTGNPVFRATEDIVFRLTMVLRDTMFTDKPLKAGDVGLSAIPDD